MKKYLSILGVLVLGTAIRLINYTGISLWHDEAFSALLIKYPFSEMIHRIGLDVHPPLYYIFLRIWAVPFGDSLASLRGFSVFFGVGTIMLAYLLVKAVFKSERAALICALLVALNPFQIQYVSEARMYTMGAFFAVLAAFLLVRALDFETLKAQTQLDAQANKKRILYYILFALSSGIMMLTHYYLLFTAAALCGYAFLYTAYLYRFQIKNYISLLLTGILILASFAPYIPTFLYQFKQVGAGYWIPPIDRWSIPTTLWQMLVGIGVDIAKPRTQILVSIVTAITVFLLVQFARKAKGQHKWLILIALVAPFAGSLAFAVLAHLKGSSTSVYLIRYFLYASTFYTIIIGLWLSNISWRKTSAGIMSVYVGICLFSVYHFWDDVNVKARPGMGAAAKYLKANVGPNDKLYVGSSFEFFNYKYYNQLPETATGVTPFLFSGGTTDIRSLPHYAGTAILTNEDRLPDFKAATKPGDTVWRLWTNGFGGSKPTTPDNFEKVGEEVSYPDIRPYIGTYIYVTQYKVK